MNINQLYSKYCKQQEVSLKKEANAKSLLQALAKKTKNVGNVVKDKAIDLGNVVKDKAIDAGKSIKDTAVDAGETVTDFAVRNPKTSITAALTALLNSLKD